MSAEQSAQLRGIAEVIFVGMAAKYGSNHWDWQPVARTAIEAAEVFDRAFTERYAPQSSTPTGETQVETPTPPTAPTEPVTQQPPPLPSEQPVPGEDVPAVPVGTEPVAAPA